MAKGAARGLKRDVDSLASALGGPVLFVVKGLQAYRGNWGQGCSALGPEDELRVKEQLDRICGKYAHLSVCINAFGGSSTSAFNIGRLLRSRFERITAYIPHVAASAGTLLSLCADRILISECGYMTMVDPMLRFGPLLVQASQIVSASERNGAVWDPAELLAAESGMRMVEDQLTEVLLRSRYSKAARCSVKSRLLLQGGFHDAPVSRDELRKAGVRVAASRRCNASLELRETERILGLLVKSELDWFVRAAWPDSVRSGR